MLTMGDVRMVVGSPGRQALCTQAIVLRLHSRPRQRDKTSNRFAPTIASRCFEGHRTNERRNVRRKRRHRSLALLAWHKLCPAPKASAARLANRRPGHADAEHAKKALLGDNGERWGMLMRCVMGMLVLCEMGGGDNALLHWKTYGHGSPVHSMWVSQAHWRQERNACQWSSPMRAVNDRGATGRLKYFTIQLASL